MPPGVTSQVLSMLQALADKLGVALEHLYSVLIRQQIGVGVTGLVWSGIVAVGTLAFCLWTVSSHQAYNRKLKEHGYADGYGYVAALGVAALLGLIVTALAFQSSVLHLWNPEYYALQEIIQLVKSK